MFVLNVFTKPIIYRLPFKKYSRNLTKTVTFVSKAVMEQNGEKAKTIGTHDGTFHCDEALACYMLRKLPEYANAKIIRTRDDNVLATCDIVVDVGGKYNPKENKFDHHQKDFNETLSSIRSDSIRDQTIKLSSAGLVYTHFGYDVISRILKQEDYQITKCELDGLYTYIYENFVKEIDAIDNGINICESNQVNYNVTTHISARVGRLNPKWNQTDKANVDELFEKAMNKVGEEFRECVLESFLVWLPARMLVLKAVENRKQVHESGKFILLENFCPWIKHLLELEKELDIPKIVFCIFPDKDNWRIRSVPIEHNSFESRNPLNPHWQGTRGDELCNLSGIPGCIFCHHNGFIGGNKTKEGAIEMGLKSIVNL